jgi:hypothetical protein
MQMKIGVCLYVRDEERHIAEWLAYQDAVGFDTCFVYDNGSVDRTRSIAERMGQFQDVRVQDWNVKGPVVQHHAYDHCVKTHGREFDWLAFLDADEFVVPHTSESVGGLLEGFPTAAAVAVNWSCFGSNGKITAPDLQISAFTRRGLRSFSANRHYKTFARPSEYIHMINPHLVHTHGAYMNSDGAVLPKEEQRGLSHVPSHERCQINHYFVRSKQQWAAKVARGYQDNAKRTLEQFTQYDKNDIIDTSALRFLAAVQQKLREADLASVLNWPDEDRNAR